MRNKDELIYVVHVTNEESKNVQKWAFELGYKWADNTATVLEHHRSYLFFYSNQKRIRHSGSPILYELTTIHDPLGKTKMVSIAELKRILVEQTKLFSVRTYSVYESITLQTIAIRQGYTWNDGDKYGSVKNAESDYLYFNPNEKAIACSKDEDLSYLPCIDLEEGVKRLLGTNEDRPSEKDIKDLYAARDILSKTLNRLDK
jgi:hypothetical protein